ncbi:MAG: hypothetical protein A2648_02225 [Candidatus Lloydbacteria bacterium RIFCSPHIGHO2_01_FULL_41_20]|uniref:Cell shape-determining protein MreC n=1 Tax=Candidatus Lloydbacteria bacterium RIFCSPHIGHO2_01_FULL_41_20 TaxID=1798657 RepID=A0A1G2CQU2_9BACT|nr:MAG: hypothetical protein A2648_02225 [Candidatus Lloydbacteria bacterium RIFCSPHIGHO2_01_FULL_41_20]
MIYRQDKKLKSKLERFFIPFLTIILVVSLFLIVPSSLDRLAGTASSVFWAISGPESAISKNIEIYRLAFKQKFIITNENQSLKNLLANRDALLREYELIKQENDSLKKIFGRSGNKQLILAQVVARPNRSPYDTLIIDIGENLGIQSGNHVFANGDTLLGTVEKVYANTSIVSLFSTPGREFDARIGESYTSIKLIGRGGGSFEATLSKAIPIKEGDAVIAPTLERSILGYVTKVVEDPRDPFVEILVEAPVSFQSLRFVEIEKIK